MLVARFDYETITRVEHVNTDSSLDKTSLSLELAQGGLRDGDRNEMDKGYHGGGAAAAGAYRYTTTVPGLFKNTYLCAF